LCVTIILEVFLKILEEKIGRVLIKQKPGPKPKN